MTDAFNGDEFSENTHALLATHGNVLLAIAKSSIKHGMISNRPLDIDPTSMADELNNNGASFVTLKKNGDLRGCIGTPEAWRALAVDVAQNAYGAAFSDPRFPPLEKNETNQLHLSVSVLSPTNAIDFESEDELLSSLRPNVDGLIIEDGQMRALFLPQVWQQLPAPEDFLSHLKRKAGMGGSHFSPTFKAQRFIVGEIKSNWGEIAPL
ncbi:MAG: AmmeMemoRadiSam system protein A [Rhodospirillaceae bacterium]|nr:AmmeMemoRadiSam system protein A [Rhodospirillaceae bacterium]